MRTIQEIVGCTGRILCRYASFNTVILLVLISLNLAVDLHAQENDIRFHRIAIEEGLSQNSVMCILQDHKGFMWFGTTDGLNRYDGHNVTVYSYDPDDPNSLSNSSVRALHEDRFGILWIGTGNGLNKFDPAAGRFTRYLHASEDSDSLSDNGISSIWEDRTGVLWVGTEGGLNRFDHTTRRFSRYLHDPNEPNSLSSNNAMAVCEDHTGTLWIGTFGGGVNAYDRESGTFIRYQNEPGNFHSLSNNFVRSIYEDQSGTLWIGTDEGLNRFDRSVKRFTRYLNSPNDPHSLSSNQINEIYEDHLGVLWLGTEAGGLDRFDRATGRFVRYRNDPSNPYSLSDDRVHSIYEDRSGVLWVGTWNGGLNRFERAAKPFFIYRSDPSDPNSLSDNRIYSIYEDRDETGSALWVGTLGGLNRFDNVTKRFIHYRNEPNNPNSLSSDRVWSIVEDQRGTLWLGTSRGLNRLDRARKKFTHYKNEPSDPGSLGFNEIWTMCEDHLGFIWIGTAGGGLDRFDPETEKFTHFLHNPQDLNSLSHDTITAIFEDHLGGLWIGTNHGGLSRFDRSTERFTHYTYDPNDTGSLSGNGVNVVYEDHQKTLWVGTSSGFNRFDRTTEKFTRFTKKEGLPNDVIYGILEDGEGNLWLSTNKGLSKLNPNTLTFRNYDVSDGLQSNEFNAGAYVKSRNGEMFFGGINGFNRFHPDGIRNNPYMPPVVITDFQIFNKSVPVGKREDGRSILKKSITETERIQLSYRDRVLSFAFAALHFASPEKNAYAYRMEGFEKEWNYVGNRRFATYTNLPPRRYTFRVKGSNNDGVWNEQGVSLKISISPPFWQTWWFRSFIIAAGLSLILAVYQVRTRAVRERAEQLERRVEERTEALQKEIAERKLAEEALGESEEKHRKLFEEARDGIVLADAETKMIIDCNRAVAELVGRSISELIGKHQSILHPPEEIGGEFSRSFKQHVKEREGEVLEARVITKNGEIKDVAIKANFIELKGKKILQGLFRDITERKRAEEQIRKSLKEKEVLLREVHHRVKNNLQVISSLLNLQSQNIKDKKTRAILEESRNRVRSMALVHEKLYQSKDFAGIDFAGYIKSLVRSLWQLYRIDPKKVDLDIKVEEISLSVDSAVPCGLIINELVSNAMKHAFPPSWKGKGRIGIVFHKTGKDEIELVVGDNGVGMPEDLDIKTADSLGLKLVTILAEEQLEGKITLDRKKKGTTFRIKLKF